MSMASLELDVKKQLCDSAELKFRIAEELAAELVEVAFFIADCFRGGNKLVLFGNGGSAADAQHIAGEFVGHLREERKPFPAIALSVNSSVVTALANDYGFGLVFARQIDAWVRSGDVALGLSTSGRSENVLLGLRRARELGALTVAFAGGDGGRLFQVADKVLVVPSFDTPRIQEGHITMGHIVCDIVEKKLVQNGEEIVR